MVGLVEPVDRSCGADFRQAGDVVALVGAIRGEVSGSEYLAAVHGEQGRPPTLDLARERAVQVTVRRAVREGLLSSAHGCSGGGLAVALAECCMMSAPEGDPTGGLGAAVRVPFPARKDFVLFGEDASRVVVSLAYAAYARLEEIAREEGAPLIRLGAVGGVVLEIQGALSVPVSDLAAASRGGIAATAPSPPAAGSNQN
jgi:phosphoribosylformylglycinamidine synthase